MDEDLRMPESDESARRTGRESARGPQVEIITRGERRRSWTLEQKREIVAESFGSELRPSEIARKHAIGTGQLYTWRRERHHARPADVVLLLGAPHLGGGAPRPRHVPGS